MPTSPPPWPVIGAPNAWNLGSEESAPGRVYEGTFAANLPQKVGKALPSSIFDLMGNLVRLMDTSQSESLVHPFPDGK